MNRFIAIALVATLFGGCSLKDISKPIAKYTIDDKTQVIKEPSSVDKILKIAKLKTPEHLQNSSLWYIKPSLEMNAYLYSSWNDDFENLVEKNIATNIYDSGIFKSLYTRYSKVKPDLLLEGEIVEAVQEVAQNQAVVAFKIRLYLIDVKNSSLVGSKEFKYLQKCESIDAKGAVIAYDNIIKDLNKDVIIWLKRSMKIN